MVYNKNTSSNKNPNNKWFSHMKTFVFYWTVMSITYNQLTNMNTIQVDFTTLERPISTGRNDGTLTADNNGIIVAISPTNLPATSTPTSSPVTSSPVTAEPTNSPTSVDPNNIWFLSGMFGSNSERDQKIKNQCMSQVGYNHDNGNGNPDGIIHDNFCSGTIANETSCCFCYENIYPTFVYEENSQQVPGALSIKFLNKDQIPYDTTPNSNSYKTEFYANSYYFCMHPRQYGIDNTDWKSQLLGTRKLIAVTGKLGHNEMFRDEVTNNCNRIKRIGVFDEVHCHYAATDYMKKDGIFENHMKFLTDPNDASSRGGGYWFHKASAIHHYLHVYNDDDIIFWVDVDTLHMTESLRFRHLLQTILSRDADLALEVMPFREAEWTKEDIFNAFNATESMRQSKQVMGGFQIYRNAPIVRQYYNALLECNADYHMISDEASLIPNRPDFIENRHDQSIMSQFYKTFLTEQTIIGPPIQSTSLTGKIYTFKVDPTKNLVCPFPSFYRQFN